MLVFTRNFNPIKTNGFEELKMTAYWKTALMSFFEFYFEIYLIIKPKKKHV